MTAEIAIMNKEGIALAADSAVTVQNGTTYKIFSSANKLFALSKVQPVGIMFYGNALINQIPWEILIKSYRKKLGSKEFNKLEEYVTDFIDFLNESTSFFPKIAQDMDFNDRIEFLTRSIRSQFVKELDLVAAAGSVTDEDAEILFEKFLVKNQTNYKTGKTTKVISEQRAGELVQENKKLIDESIERNLGPKTMSKENWHNLIIEIIKYSLTGFLPQTTNRETGIVIAGYGRDDFFPKLRSIRVDGVIENKVKYIEDVGQEIPFSYTPPAAIVPFAQDDMTIAFATGVNHEYQELLESYLSELFSIYPDTILEKIEKLTPQERQEIKEKLRPTITEILEKTKNRLSQYRQKQYIQPLLDVVGSLPKDQLAEIAESLVNLTSFKRKMSLDLETVAGPIDVAVISKGDGFIWIKRKHYFKPELNPQYFVNYNRGGNGNAR